MDEQLACHTKDEEAAACHSSCVAAGGERDVLETFMDICERLNCPRIWAREMTRNFMQTSGRRRRHRRRLAECVFQICMAHGESRTAREIGTVTGALPWGQGNWRPQEDTMSLLTRLVGYCGLPRCCWKEVARDVRHSRARRTHSFGLRPHTEIALALGRHWRECQGDCQHRYTLQDILRVCEISLATYQRYRRRRGGGGGARQAGRQNGQARQGDRDRDLKPRETLLEGTVVSGPSKAAAERERES